MTTKLFTGWKSLIVQIEDGHINFFLDILDISRTLKKCLVITKAYRRKPESCLGRVFQMKLSSFYFMKSVCPWQAFPA